MTPVQCRQLGIPQARICKAISIKMLIKSQSAAGLQLRTHQKSCVQQVLRSEHTLAASVRQHPRPRVPFARHQTEPTTTFGVTIGAMSPRCLETGTSKRRRASSATARQPHKASMHTAPWGREAAGWISATGRRDHQQQQGLCKILSHSVIRILFPGDAAQRVQHAAQNLGLPRYLRHALVTFSLHRQGCVRTPEPASN